MDQSTLVNLPIRDGLRLLRRLTADGFPIRAAFWARPEDASDWRLVIASEQGMEVSRAASEAVRTLDGLALSILDLGVVGPNDGIVTRGSAAEYGYRYPPKSFAPGPAGTMTPDEVRATIFRLLDRGPDVAGPPRVTLKDGNFFDGVPFAVTRMRDQGLTAEFTDGLGPPRVVRIDDIASIT